MVALLSRIARYTSIRSDFISTISPDSRAMSLPDPTAQPTSAWTRAGASLIPSPTIITVFPSRWRRLTTSALSPGRTSATTWSTWACLPMYSAVFRLSPVTIYTAIPRPRICFTASRLVSLMVSATQIIPARRPSSTTYMGVFPSLANRAACSLVSSAAVT